MFQELAPARSSNILSIAESHGEDVLHPPKSKTPLPSEASAIALELGKLGPVMQRGRKFKLFLLCILIHFGLKIILWLGIHFT